MIVNANSIVQYVIQNKNGIKKHVNVNVKIVVSAKKIIVASTCICENSKYLKNVADTAVTECDEIVIVINKKDKYYSKKKDKCYKYCFNKLSE